MLRHLTRERGRGGVPGGVGFFCIRACVCGDLEKLT